MANRANDYNRLRERLNNRVQCPYRLYPARLRALGIVVNKDLLLEIKKRIASRIPDYVDMGWYEQFQRDFDTFGLYEAILYFHTYSFPDRAENFINDACDVYDDIASLYMSHHVRIENSDDPRIQDQLQTIRHMGGGYQHVSRLQRQRLEKPDVIHPPARPPDVAGYRRRLPVNEDAKLVFGSFGWNDIGEPGNIADEVIEHLTSRFMFEDFPGLQLVFFEGADMLAQFETDPFSSTGQFVLQTIIEEMNEEFFGDYDRWMECISCGKSFMPDVTLSNANVNLLQGGWVCEQCKDQKS